MIQLPTPQNGRSAGWAFRCELVGLFLVAVAVKWWLIARVGSDLPWIDQWGPEADLYRQWLSGALRWRDFFQPANEHRIVFTHLLNLGLLRLNGQWDPLLQMAVNALLNAAGTAVLAWWIGRGLPVVTRRLVLLVVGIVMIAPFGIQNIVWGFQSQIYLCLLLSCGALWLTTEWPASNWRWWAGAAVAISAYFAMSPGALVGAALLAWVAWRIMEERRISKEVLPNLLLGGLVLLMAWGLRTPIPRHDVLVAPDFLRFAQVLTGVLSWPACDPRLFLVLNAPVLVLLVGRLTGRLQATVAADRAQLLAAWAVGVALTFSYYRGGAQDPFSAPPSRHADFFALLPIANVLALAQLGTVFERRKAVFLTGGAIWLVCSLVGIVSLLRDTLDNIHEHVRLRYQMGFDVLALRETGERRETLLFSVDGSIASCTARLKDPLFQSLMPPLLQKEIALAWPSSGALLQTAVFPPGSQDPSPLTVWRNRNEGAVFQCGAERSEPFEVLGPAVEVLAAFTARGGKAEIVFVSEDSGSRIALPCDSAPRGKWVKLSARLPAGRYRLEVSNRDPAGWVAFSAPRKMGWLGYRVRQVLPSK
ncbi:MAG TPA: hypothetical protein VK178_04235 [Opitutaceae bacterium]|nr:hypothetical protein [Opitutaceae bacterium]